MDDQIPTNLRDVCNNYTKLSTNLKQVPDQTPDMTAKMELIDRMITDLNVSIEDLNFEIIQHKVTMNAQDQEDYNDMLISKNTIKLFSPYIVWLNMYQKLSKKDDQNYLSN